MDTSRSRVDRLFLRMVGYVVILHGIVIIATILDDQVHIRLGLHRINLSGFVFDLPILLGLSLTYVGTLLLRRKRTAWVTAFTIYSFIILLNIFRLLVVQNSPTIWGISLFRELILPVMVLGILYAYKDQFKVRSDLRSFTVSLRTAAVVLAVAFIYGVSGFMLLDQRDFHQEMSLATAAHYTVDQFGLTTAKALHPYTRRARLFDDSLSVISLGAVVYAVASFFQPIRARITNQVDHGQEARHLLEQYGGSSEDFFKLWPTDKTYYFSPTHQSFIAYQVRRGVALAVGDPAGTPDEYKTLLKGFLEFCELNDWLPTFIHTEPTYSNLYRDHDFSLQKIGEEAVVDLAKFKEEVAGNKYFRNVRNKFTKAGYTTELMHPPHADALLLRLKEINQDWLKQPGRSERGFMMGYASDEYMQQCNIMVIKDTVGTIRGYINQIPSFDKAEANFDLLRSTSNSMSNTNDFLLMGFMDYLSEAGFKRLNLGLCPLAGLHNTDQDSTVIDAALRFLYANGDRFYSFSGLHRFKAKYEPEWSGRYIAYRGGLRGFTRIMTALNRAMKVK